MIFYLLRFKGKMKTDLYPPRLPTKSIILGGKMEVKKDLYPPKNPKKSVPPKIDIKRIYTP